MTQAEIEQMEKALTTAKRLQTRIKELEEFLGLETYVQRKYSEREVLTMSISLSFGNGTTTQTLHLSENDALYITVMREGRSRLEALKKYFDTIDWEDMK